MDVDALARRSGSSRSQRRSRSRRRQGSILDRVGRWRYNDRGQTEATIGRRSIRNKETCKKCNMAQLISAMANYLRSLSLSLTAPRTPHGPRNAGMLIYLTHASACKVAHVGTCQSRVPVRGPPGGSYHVCSGIMLLIARAPPL